MKRWVLAAVLVLVVVFFAAQRVPFVQDRVMDKAITVESCVSSMASKRRMR